MSQCSPMFDLKISVGHCDLYFTVHFAFYFEDNLTSYIEIMSQYDPTFDFKINVSLCCLYFMVQ